MFTLVSFKLLHNLWLLCKNEIFKGVLFIVLNSQYYVDATRVPDLKKGITFVFHLFIILHYINNVYNDFEEYIFFIAQDNWLDHVLNLGERKKAKHTIMFQHIPWFLHQVILLVSRDIICIKNVK